MRYIYALLLAVILTGCATLEPTREYSFETKRSIAKPYADVMTSLKAWCVTNGFSIQSAADGVLLATSDLTAVQGTTANYADGVAAAKLCADCGKNPAGMFVSRSGSLNAVVESTGNNQTTVTLLFTAKPPEGTLSVRCASTGVVEGLVFSHLGKE
ncbi:MAG: hypothetical protein JNL32_03635 [Candidatus Kapabacteria bacterium]|nr:hypothetical protein [Candidatus Kapabacteria bacterium]